MIDKGKYASHGTYIKRLPASSQAQTQKSKLAVIHPLPSSVARTAEEPHQLQGVVLQSKTLSTKFRFQDNIDRKPVKQQLTQPFIYIEKVIKKQKVDAKVAALTKLEPFITSTSMRPRTTKKDKGKVASKASPVPQGYSSLYDYEEDKRVTAGKLFQQLLDGDVQNLKDMFLLWSGKNRKLTPEIDIKEGEFVDFIKEVLPGKVAEKQIRRFFELYRNPAPKGKQKEETYRSISLKAFSFNYDKYRRVQTEVANILSLKSLKERYMWAKNYLSEFDLSYPQLKTAMNSIKNYEESLKNHFRQLYNSYKNPYESQIEGLQRELEKPIIKYDKLKKNELNSRIEFLTVKHQQLHSKLTVDFQNFLQQYQTAVLPNHDLFFTKRILCKLLLPLLTQRPTLTRSAIQQRVQQEQGRKQQFLECLSDLVVEIDQDKKHLGQDNFTLDEMVQLVLMRNRRTTVQRYSEQFIIYSSKKLIKEIKKQFLLKNQLQVDSLDHFPADQEIPLQLLHSCFQMECTKVLFKNQIWNQIINFVPAELPQQSKLHQNTIEGNLCLQLVRRYFLKLDQRIKVELNKSKQISLLAENVSLDQFGTFGSVVEGVLSQINNYVEDDQGEVADKVGPLGDRKKVTFGDVIDMATEMKNFPPQQTENDLQRQQEQNLVQSLLKSIFEVGSDKKQQQMPSSQSLIGQTFSKIREPTFAENLMEINASNLQDVNNLARSVFEAEGLNTNSFDIRYFQKQKAKIQRPVDSEVIRMGSSILLSNLPKVEELTSSDPLKISRLLMTTIDQGIQEERKVVRQQPCHGNIREGVSSNYYQEKIKLENKPTIYDSQGKSKYSVLLPVGYYQNFIAAQNIPEDEKWYLRPHHVETLTQNPLSKKDNIINTEYKSKLEKLPTKKRPDQFVIEANVQRKSEAINSLEDRLTSLKKELETASRGSRIQDGKKVPSAVIDNYMTKLTQGKTDKDLEIATFEGVLYDLRRKERDLLNDYRDKEKQVEGEPGQKWWERKDKNFNVQLRKERLMASDSISGQQKHRQYVSKLENSEIY